MKPRKKPSLLSQDEARRANMLMEQMLSKFGESLAIRAHIEAIHEMQSDLKNINQRLEVVEAKS